MMKKASFGTLELEAPADWMDLSVLTLASPPSPRAGKFRPNVVVTRDELEEAPDVSAYAQQQTRELRKTTKRYVLHKEGPATAGRRNAYAIEHSFRAADNTQVRQIQVFVARGRTVFALALTSAEEQFPEMRAAFTAIARSFRVS